jgi:putative OPT family oligopeptide transporter
MADSERERSGSNGTGDIGGLSVAAILLGLAATVVMTAANVYLGLYAGMTVSASIPAAVAALAVFRLLRRRSLHQSNVVQTMASAGESLAAGVLFTVPALVLTGAWERFHYWQTTLMALCGGLLGVVFMIPLRRVLIVQKNELTYPEGVACSGVLRAGAGQAGGMLVIGWGAVAGASAKLAGSGLGLVAGAVEWATRVGGRVVYVGSDIAPALLAVGYIINLRIAVLVFVGGAMGWLVGVPLLSGEPVAGEQALDAAWRIWSTRIRYVGVGAMIVGGLWSIVTMRSGIVAGLGRLRDVFAGSGSDVTGEAGRDMPLGQLGATFVVCTALILVLYRMLTGSMPVSLTALVCMVVAAFVFSAVSSYITGLVGSSNNPVSGMTISALLGTALFFVVLGFEGRAAIVATLGVAAVVCCAACTAGDCSQDLKTGHLVGTSPRAQQYAQILGVVAASLVIAPVLTLLHVTYGIGEGLKAPQSVLFARLTEGIFGSRELPSDMLAAGAAVGVAVVVIDTLLKRSGARFRLHVMPVAVGIYLPFSLSVPILAGGLVHAVVTRRSGADKGASGPGTLFSSGLIAGEALMGVAVAALVYLEWNVKVPHVSGVLQNVLGVAVLTVVGGALAAVAGGRRGELRP